MLEWIHDNDDYNDLRVKWFTQKKHKLKIIEWLSKNKIFIFFFFFFVIFYLSNAGDDDEMADRIFGQ